MSVPATVTRAAVEDEIVPAVAWARRRGWLIRWEPDSLTLRAASYHPAIGRLVEAFAALDGYPAAPPAWQFVVPATDEPSRSAWPAPGQQSGVSGSIFHPTPCICAPWNRLAYSAQGGPHGDWSMTSWRSVQGGQTKADHIADMLDQIHMHLQASPGLQA